MTDAGPTTEAAPEPTPVADPRRWITLGVLVGTVVLVALDQSVLNVSIPTMLRDLDTTVPALEWVVAGYALTIASLLIVGGRLGDIFGHRKLFVIGASLFGLGSLISALSPNVGVLILGEAVVEGVGAALMVPATLALLSLTFHGRERATAFAAWGAAAGVAVAFGPVVGGYLTTNFSWRWSFGINVILAPLAVIGALVLMTPGKVGDRTPIDVPGAALIASGMFCIVFALSQGPTYGWLEPEEALSPLGHDVWPTSMPVSIVAVAFVLGLALLALFVRVERRLEAAGGDPLFEFGQLRYRTFRYGLITAVIVALGQLGLLFALPLFLQGANGLTAEQNGLWMLPIGLMIIVGAQLGGRLNHRFGTTNVVRVGFLLEALGLLLVVPVIEPGVSFLALVPGIACFGLGVGAASAQLTTLVLAEVPMDRSGVASGANSTARQVGAALGATVVGSLITVLTTSHALDAIRGAGLPATLADEATRGAEAMGANWTVPSSGTPEQTTALQTIYQQALTTGVRWALTFAVVVVFAGALVSLLIPQVRHTDGETLVGDAARGAARRRRTERLEPEAPPAAPVAVEHG